MTRVRPPEGEALLVSWVSVGAGADPLVSALAEGSPLHRKIGRVILCWRDAPDARDELVLEQTRAALLELDPTLEVEDRQWKTKAQPTDHAAIRAFAEPMLRQVRAIHPRAHIFLHLSPGTPSMHAIWLVLGSTGHVEGPITMIQGVPSNRRAAKAPPIEAVPLEVDNWLRRFRDSRPKSSGMEDDGHLWRPTELSENGPMRRVLDQLDEWAALPAPVLLLGERGTGKSTLANYLRSIGPFQRSRPKGDSVVEWPAVVCGQFRANPQLARSELFGHRKGAFTGADVDHEGLLEQADGDSLFLDEIADLDRDTQRLLMAALEGRGFHRLGDTARRHSSFRLICATNRPSEELLGGLLDPDFFDRISIFALRVPALRECGDDLPVFWRGVLRRVQASAGAMLPDGDALAEDAHLLAELRARPLRGNLRDLQRVAWHIVARRHAKSSRADAIDHALAALDNLAAPPKVDAEGLRAQLPLSRPLPDLLDEQRQAWIDAALSEADNNKSRAAQLLQVGRETLNGWLRKRR